MRHWCWWAFFIGFFVAAPTVQAQDALLANRLERIRKKYDGIGLAVVAVKNDSIIYEQAFGLKNREDSVALRPGDVFRIASVSKTFVTTAIMQLVEEGLLSLDDDVNRFLDFRVRNPRFPEVAITLKMLLSHRSSLNDSQGRYSFDVLASAENPNQALCYNDYAPGDAYDYCNQGYNLLGAVIERVSNMRFDEYIREHIMIPMRLHGSFNVADQDSDFYVSAYTYNRQKKRFRHSSTAYKAESLDDYRLGYSTPIFSPPGGMKISASELASYMIMHMDDGQCGKTRIISPQSEQQMREVETLERKSGISFRHYTNVIDGEELVGRTGSALGIHSAMIFHPQQRYGFVVICNGCKSKYRNGFDLSREAMRCMYRHLIKAD